MADPVQGVSVTIEEPDNSVTIDPVTGTIVRNQGDGSALVELHDSPPDDEDDAESKFYDNLVDKIDGGKLGTIANDLFEQIQADWSSASNYRDILRRGLDFMGLELKEPRSNAAGDTSSAVEGQSVVTNPLLLNACLRSWANAQAELLPSEGPCKVEVNEEIETESKDSLADALERDFNHYLTETATEYYPDTSHMLLWGAIFAGSGFKKVYRCPMRRRPVSDSVPSEDLIVSNTQKDLRSSSRITHQILMRPSVMKRMQLLGAYKKYPITEQPTPETTPVTQGIASIQGTQPIPQRPEDMPYTVWETQCELDLDEFAPTKFKGEGIPLPYRVTLEKDSRNILAVHRDWREDDDQCERKRLYVKYPYVPGPGFYGTGLLHILGNSSAAMTAAWREALDAGMFASFPSALIAKPAARQNTSDIRMPAGTLIPIETNGMSIRDVIAPIPYRDASSGLLAMMQQIEGQSSQLAGSAEVASPEGIQNVPVGTMLAQIEQAQKIVAAAHKGMHQAQTEEFMLLIDLFRENPEDFWKQNKVCPDQYWNEQKLLQALDDCSLVPKADPNTPSHIHRIAKAIALTQLFLNPAFAQRLNVDETLERVLRAMREDPQGLLLPPPDPNAQQPPDAQTIAAYAKLQGVQVQDKKVQVEAAKVQAGAQETAVKTQADRDIATVDLARESVIHQADVAKANREAAQAALEAHRSHAVDVAGHGLDVAQFAHDRQKDIAEHNLNVFQATNPPEPTEGAGS